MYLLMNDHELYQLLGSLDAKVDQLLAAEALRAKGDALVEARLSSLERNQSWLKGAAAVAGTFGTLIGAVFGWVLNRMGVI